MSEKDEAPERPVSIDAPRHPVLQSLFAYWTKKRGERLMPARADIQPSEIKQLLPDVMIYSVSGASGPFIVRLMGENVVNFLGRNSTGKPVTDGKSEEATALMNSVLAQVVETKSPRFRLGKTFWNAGKVSRGFESCFLPLSTDGDIVDMILGGIKFEAFAG